MQADIATVHQLRTLPRERRGADGDARCEEQRHTNRAAHGEKRKNRDRGQREFLVPRKVPLARRSLEHRLGKKRGLSPTHMERLLRTCAHAIHALHAALVNNHAKITHFLVYAHIRCAHRRAVSALSARISHANAQRRKLVQRRKEAAVWTAISAIALGSEQIHSEKSADEQERNRHHHARKGRPEIAGDQAGAEAGPLEPWPGVRRNRKAVDNWPEKHVARQRQRQPEQEPRTKEPRANADALHEIAAEILQHHHMATPAAEPPTEDRRRKQRESKEDGADGDDAVLHRFH